jgi:hypothetical protein
MDRKIQASAKKIFGLDDWLTVHRSITLVFLILGWLSLLVHKATDEKFSDNYCRQIANNLPEMLSGILEGNIVSGFY